MDQSLTQKSYDYIRRKLAAGELSPGKRLVNRRLADEIGVSVIPVREAINRLASQGLVEHIPGAGSFVRKIDRDDLANLYVLRDALESCAAAEAAKHVSNDQLEEFASILKQNRSIAAEIRERKKGHSNKSQLGRWIDNEQYFHSLLVEASRNPQLAKVIAENRAISAVFEAQRNDPRLLTAEIAEATCESKEELVEALRDHDADRARRLMSEQIQRGRKTVLSFFARQQRFD